MQCQGKILAAAPCSRNSNPDIGMQNGDFARDCCANTAYRWCPKACSAKATVS
jgi:hypothetical protein